MTSAIGHGDEVRAVSRHGTVLYGIAVSLTVAYIRVRYTLVPPGWEHLAGTFDAYWRSSLELVRRCAWCAEDITGTAQAHPVLDGRAPRESENWQCADRWRCLDRQIALYGAVTSLVAEAFDWPTPSPKHAFDRDPVGELEAPP
jgi:hypothetical protein